MLAHTPNCHCNNCLAHCKQVRQSPPPENTPLLTSSTCISVLFNIFADVSFDRLCSAGDRYDSTALFCSFSDNLHLKMLFQNFRQGLTVIGWRDLLFYLTLYHRISNFKAPEKEAFRKQIQSFSHIGHLPCYQFGPV